MIVHRAHTLGAALSGAAAILFTLPALGATYQVGPTRQYKNLGAVVNVVGPGDVVEVDGGQQYPGGVRFTKSGTAAAKITIRGIPVEGRRPILSGGTNTVEIYANHYVLEGFDVTGGTSRCYFHHGDDITVRDCVIHDCPAHGVLGADEESGSLLLEYTEVHHCGSGTQYHQIYMATDETTYPGSVFRMQHCWVHDGIGGNNVKSRAERNEIYYNWVQGALYHELELIGPDGQDEDLAREDSDVVGNVLVKDNADSYVVRFGGDGTGQTFGRYRFVNNTVLVRPSGGAVFRLFDGIASVEMHNNVFVVRGGGAVNVVRQTEAAWATGASIIAGSNNWVSTGSTNVPSTWLGTLTGADPGFAALASLDVRPAQTSPLVNAGASVLTGPPGQSIATPLALPAMHPPLHAAVAPGTAPARPAVGAIDIGAFEYGVGAGDSGGAGGSGAGGSGAGGSGAGGSGAGGQGGSVVQPAGSGGALGAGGSPEADAGAPASSSACNCTTSRGRIVGVGSFVLALLAVFVIVGLRRRKRALRAKT